MTISINYKYTLFEQSKLTPIRGKSTFKILHKLQNEIKADAKAVYSNIWGGSHGHIGLFLTDAQYLLISNTPFIYPTHPGPLIIPDGTTAHVNSNTKISLTKEVPIFHVVTDSRKIVTTVEGAYISDISNRMTNSINNTVAYMLTCLQENYVQLIPHELLERKEIIKKTTYHPHNRLRPHFMPSKKFSSSTTSPVHPTLKSKL